MLITLQKKNLQVKTTHMKGALSMQFKSCGKYMAKKIDNVNNHVVMVTFSRTLVGAWYRTDPSRKINWVEKDLLFKKCDVIRDIS